MGHPNADIAADLVVWRDTKVDRHGVLQDAQRKGFVSIKGGELVLTQKGIDFITKWTQGKPAGTYVRKPSEGPDNGRQSTYSNRSTRDSWSTW